MNWVDLVITGMLGLACVNGFRRGAVMQAFSWGGFLMGLLVGGLFAPPLMRAIGPNAKVALAVSTIVAFLAIAFVIEALVAFGGSFVVRRITHHRLRKVDAIGGSVVAGVLALLAAWFLSLPLQRSPDLGPAIKDSVVLRGMRAVLHEPPNLLAAIGSLLNATGFPEVFAQINPSLAPGVEPAPASLRNDRQVLAAARLTYKIESLGCGGKVDGSGFPVRAGVVLTAAHVVAGTHGTTVIEAGGAAYPATVVYMNSDKDIAILYVPSLPARVLSVDDHRAMRGEEGAAIGYPGGGPRKISPARVRQRVDALGFDIYSSRRVSREIYVLRAEVRQGNSGGPFVDTDGKVHGVVFAASARNEEESYALAETEIEAALRKGGDRHQSVRTGRCAV